MQTNKATRTPIIGLNQPALHRKILNLIDFRHIARWLHALFLESCSTGHIRAGIDQIGKA